ncbi:hypothetical protein Sa4125_27430 [Aureimonas sp. SA4125]|uniref:hypothetical protein n=1 Tax=Aureimonas sp. SA4125 TaxID=2826993 RepID=UPI001CC6A19D|nr:hypothetical protein [Aureimonas sp. SA4125]BDA85201.1 hypothetical protein Sa4125_27430 [Aureimonas sp. SA4125]
MSNTTNFPNQTPNARVPDQARDTLNRAETEASSLAGEAKAAVNDLGDRAKQGVVDAADRIRGLAEEQKSAGADRFKGYAGSINRAADSLDDEMPMVANLARRAAGEIEHLADSVKDRELADLVGVVHDYARRQPAIFLGATAFAGFLAVRFLSASAEKRTQQAGTGSLNREPGPQAGYRPRPTGYTPS